MLRTVGSTTLKFPRLRPWRELALFSLVIMELCWVVPWYRALSRGTHAVPVPRAFLILGSILLVTLWAVRIMEYFHLKLSVRQAVLGVLVVVSVLIGVKTLLYPFDHLSFGELVQLQYESISSFSILIPDEFLVTVIILLTWWRGMNLSRIQIGPRDVLAKFQLGIGILIAFIFLNTLITKEDVGELIYLFLFSGLLALSSARVTVLSQLRGGQRNPFDGRWFAGMFFTAVWLVGVVILLVQMGTGEAQLLHQIALGLFFVAVGIVLIISLPIVIIFSVLLEFFLKLTGNATFKILETLSNSLYELRQNMELLARELFETMEKTGIFKVFEFVGSLTPLIRWALILGVGAVIFFLIRLRIKRLRARPEYAENRLFTMSRMELLKHLQDQIRDGILNLVDNVRGLMTSDGRRRRRAAAEVRRIYINLLDLTEELGQPRFEAQTPLEYLPVLERVFPDCTDEVQEITNAYQKVRYGQLPENKAEVERLRESWVVIERQRPAVKE